MPVSAAENGRYDPPGSGFVPCDRKNAIHTEVALRGVAARVSVTMLNHDDRAAGVL
jgi:hypothetical protein